MQNPVSFPSVPCPASPHHAPSGEVPSLDTDSGVFGSWRKALGVGALMLGLVSGCSPSKAEIEREMRAHPQPTPTQLVARHGEYLGSVVTLSGAPKLERDASFTRTETILMPMIIGETTILMPMDDTVKHTRLWYRLADPAAPGSTIALLSEKPLSPTTYLVSGELKRDEQGALYLHVKKSLNAEMK